MKKNKLKIDPSRAGAQRMVFDDEGVALPPLAALARQSREVMNAPPGTVLTYSWFTVEVLESARFVK